MLYAFFFGNFNSTQNMSSLLIHQLNVLHLFSFQTPIIEYKIETK